MTKMNARQQRPPVRLLDAESTLVANLALQSEREQPVVSAMLLDEIERAELHRADTMPAGHVQLNSHVTFVDEQSGKRRDVQLVLPGKADIAQGRISILTPIGAALYGLAAGFSITWPDRGGTNRTIRVLGVSPGEPEAGPGRD